MWDRGLAFRLLMLGGHHHGIDPHLRAVLEEARRRWTSRVTIREWTDDFREVARAYLSCHCVVVPSYVEPFGLVALEALAGGCYLLASDAGGLPEIAGEFRVRRVPAWRPRTAGGASERFHCGWKMARHAHDEVCPQSASAVQCRSDGRRIL
jgi:glycosyltransferase involved in cell wall biosynthesis